MRTMSSPTSKRRCPGRQPSDAREFFGEEISPTSRKKKKKKFHHCSLFSTHCTSSSHSPSHMHKTRNHHRCSSPTSTHSSVSHFTDSQTIATYRQSNITTFLTNVSNSRPSDQQIRTPPRSHCQLHPSLLAPVSLQHSSPSASPPPSPCLPPEPAHD